VPLPVVTQGDGLAEARESYLWGGYKYCSYSVCVVMAHGDTEQGQARPAAALAHDQEVWYVLCAPPSRTTPTASGSWVTQALEVWMMCPF
jgi:hypothetical protein